MFNVFDEYTMEEIGEFVFDSACPAHCVSCGNYAGDFEPDAHDYECEECGTNTVASVIELALF